MSHLLTSRVSGRAMPRAKKMSLQAGGQAGGMCCSAWLGQHRSGEEGRQAGRLWVGRNQVVGALAWPPVLQSVKPLLTRPPLHAPAVCKYAAPAAQAPRAEGCMLRRHVWEAGGEGQELPGQVDEVCCLCASAEVPANRAAA